MFFLESPPGHTQLWGLFILHLIKGYFRKTVISTNVPRMGEEALVLARDADIGPIFLPPCND
jgi:hypothetical protein